MLVENLIAMSNSLNPFFSNPNPFIERINELLDEYSNRRKHKFVGQFWDDVGITDTQYGLYGMAMFSVLTRSSDNLSIADRKLRCLNEFKKLIAYGIKNPEKTDTQNVAINKVSKITSSSYEIKNVLFKTFLVYEACTVNNLSKEAKILANYIEKNLSPTGFFGKTGNTQLSIVATSMAFRNFYNYNNIEQSNNIKSSIEYLLRTSKKVEQPFIKLYVYNSLQIFLDSNPQYYVEKKHQEIRAGIKQIINEIATNRHFQLKYSVNPINIDYNDSGRTRYFRLYTDLILIESLSVAEKNHLFYLNSRFGVDILKRVDAALKSDDKIDSTNHRLSAGYCYNLYKIITLASGKFDTEDLIYGIKGSYNRWVMFGINRKKDTLVFIVVASVVVLQISVNIIYEHVTGKALKTYYNIGTFIITIVIAKIQSVYTQNK